MKLTPTTIAKHISKIINQNYSHHDLHYTTIENEKNYSLLTAYQGMSPYTFSILENGKLKTSTTYLIDLLFGDIFKDVLTNTLLEKYKDVVTQKQQYDEAEQWIKDNNVIQILKDNLSPFYKSLMNKKNLQTETKIFLYDYANGIYGKDKESLQTRSKGFNLNKETVDKFIDKANETQLKEALSWTEFKKEMIEDKKGASDLEDFIDFVIRK